MNSGNIRDISNFRPAFDEPDQFDPQSGDFEWTHYDSQGGHINVEGSYGYNRPLGTPGGETIREPHVLHIGYISVGPEGVGLGTAALAEVITQAQQRGYHVARMQIVHSHIVGAVEHLIAAGVVDTALYHVDENTKPHLMPATDTFAADVDLQTGGEARQRLEEWESLEAAGSASIDELGAVDCVLTFS